MSRRYKMKKKEKECLNKAIEDFVHLLYSRKYVKYGVTIYLSNFFFLSFFDIIFTIRNQLDILFDKRSSDI